MKIRHFLILLVALGFISSLFKCDGGKKHEAAVLIPSGALSEKYFDLHGKPFNVAMRNGEYEKSRDNDIEELAKDWVFYRKEILKCAASGDGPGAASARKSFNEVNAWLNKYDERDVSFILSRVK